jgi:hypothetical protein
VEVQLRVDVDGEEEEEQRRQARGHAPLARHGGRLRGGGDVRRRRAHLGRRLFAGGRAAAPQRYERGVVAVVRNVAVRGHAVQNEVDDEQHGLKLNVPVGNGAAARAQLLRRRPAAKAAKDAAEKAAAADADAALGAAAAAAQAQRARAAYHKQTRHRLTALDAHQRRSVRSLLAQPRPQRLHGRAPAGDDDKFI